METANGSHQSTPWGLEPRWLKEFEMNIFRPKAGLWPNPPHQKTSNFQSYASISRTPGIALTLGIAVSTLLVSPATAGGNNGSVNIYSYRQPGLIKPLLKAFTAKTGIRVRIIFAKNGLSERIAAEGRNSPADILLTSDIGRLAGATKLGIAQKVSSEIINSNIPARFRDRDGNWIGLTSRARIIFASKDGVKQPTITYEELAEPKWKGRICPRSGQHVYSIGLFASLIAHHGVAWTEKWLGDVRGNLARKPSGNDRGQVKSIFSGECDVALGNTYYMGKMETNDKEPVQKEWASAVRIMFPNAEGRGTHVNVSGMVLAKYAPNRKNAIKLMEYLTTAKAQQIYSEINFEYPVKPGVPASSRVESWGKLNADKLELGEIARYRKTASELVDKVGFNNGPNS